MWPRYLDSGDRKGADGRKTLNKKMALVIERIRGKTEKKKYKMTAGMNLRKPWHH